jgi:CheY-like chemotaxis protein
MSNIPRKQTFAGMSGVSAKGQKQSCQRPETQALSRLNGIWNDYDQTSLPPVTEIPSNAFIVVVDDDVFERMGASCMFADEGYRVLEAENANEALRFLETNADITLLFTDVSMPGSMSGSDLAHHVAKRWPMVGIIITSGRPSPDPLPSGTQFHAKPYHPTSVLQHARNMMVSYKSGARI